MAETASDYHPLLTTLRLYAGWLLACLSVIYIVGSYQELREFPFKLSLAKEWIESSVILHVAFTTFIFMLLSTVHMALGRGVWKGVMLAVIGFAAIAVFMVNA